MLVSAGPFGIQPNEQSEQISRFFLETAELNSVWLGKQINKKQLASGAAATVAAAAAAASASAEPNRASDERTTKSNGTDVVAVVGAFSATSRLQHAKLTDADDRD